jgi:NDP-sugar pyrophosphorylase family protein
MNVIRKRPIQSIGYGFIPDEYLPKGKDEYHLRNHQHGKSVEHRRLKAFEIESLVRNNNTSDDWNNILVSESFNPELVRNCKFFGLVRIGRLEPWYLEYHNLRVPVGLYNSTIISSDLGDNIVINNVNYLSHYIIGDDVIIVNVNELATTNTAKFGNGIIKDGETESVRIRMEVCNENGGRSILAFDGMLPGDAFLWSKYRDDLRLMEAFERFTERTTDRQRGYYGVIGDRTVVKNCKIIKDVRIGSDAYLKGANKIKNVTINSSPEAMSQVGEGCELVNGIIGYGCRVFYGVKAVRFVMASHSQLKYGARLINAYLGNNATISCCEVLNALIYPFHEQHHNNSFLCAALVMGQSNMAAGATIGSNHNSRANDGELVAGRGFWPGLCVSLKHNSRFASFSILAKGDYEAEIRNPFPFSLISQDLSRGRLQVMPAYWFMYNLYGLCRNEWKYKKRDQRTEKIQHIETAFLAPDSVNEMMDALTLLASATGRAMIDGSDSEGIQDRAYFIEIGRQMLESEEAAIDALDIMAEDIENSNRKVVLFKVRQSYAMYLRMLRLYGIEGLLDHIASSDAGDMEKVAGIIPFHALRGGWTNVGGQLIPNTDLNQFRADIGQNKYNSWADVHQFYQQQSDEYRKQRNIHAMACLIELGVINMQTFNASVFRTLVDEAVDTKRWVMRGILESRQKDYANPFRQMVYETEAEMEQVLGRIDDNAFIQDQQEALSGFEDRMAKLLYRIGL